MLLVEYVCFMKQMYNKEMKKSEISLRLLLTKT